MPKEFFIDPDIRRARTLPAWFYRDPEIFGRLRREVFQRSWQIVPGPDFPADAEKARAFRLLDGFIGEPLLLTRDTQDEVRCLSNVCTHRGNLLVSDRSGAKKLVCGYHGRRFALDGTFEFMPEFEQTEDFPSACDHLREFPLQQWGPLRLTSLDPAFDFSEVATVMEERIGFLPLGEFRHQPGRSHTYTVKAHWALYCDNYLEGFHIPFVHKSLDAVLDYGQYDTLLFEHCNLQIGYAQSEEDVVFELPEGHVDHGKAVAAYYFWVFPNLMFNFYPWGLSLNIVSPVGSDLTRVHFASYVYDATKLEKGAGAGLDRVELEDEEVVEGVQQGLQSAAYSQGRFSPAREQGVHHFHRLLAGYLNAGYEGLKI